MLQTPPVKAKSIIIAIGISFVLFFFSHLFGAVSFKLKIIFGSGLYFLGTFFLVKHIAYPKKTVPFLLLLVPLLLVFVCINLLQFSSSWISLPSTISLILGCIAGFAWFKKRSPIIPATLVLLILGWTAYFNQFYVNQFSFNTIDGSVEFHQPVVTFYDATSRQYQLDEPNKIYVLDFWNSGCGVCFRKFPVVDSIARLADPSKFEVIAVNIPIRKEQKEDNYSILDSLGYSFRKLFAHQTNDADSFGVMVYPTTIVVQNHQVIFRGDFDDAVKRFRLMP